MYPYAHVFFYIMRKPNGRISAQQTLVDLSEEKIFLDTLSDSRLVEGCAHPFGQGGVGGDFG